MESALFCEQTMHEGLLWSKHFSFVAARSWPISDRFSARELSFNPRNARPSGIRQISTPSRPWSASALGHRNQGDASFFRIHYGVENAFRQMGSPGNVYR